MRTRKIANGLGWFSIALGLTEIIGAKPLSRALGLSAPLPRHPAVRAAHPGAESKQRRPEREQPQQHDHVNFHGV